MRKAELLPRAMGGRSHPPRGTGRGRQQLPARSIDARPDRKGRPVVDRDIRDHPDPVALQKAVVRGSANGGSGATSSARSRSSPGVCVPSTRMAPSGTGAPGGVIRSDRSTRYARASRSIRGSRANAMGSDAVAAAGSCARRWTANSAPSRAWSPVSSPTASSGRNGGRAARARVADNPGDRVSYGKDASLHTCG